MAIANERIKNNTNSMFDLSSPSITADERIAMDKIT
jgi:hypothetical protein